MGQDKSDVVAEMSRVTALRARSGSDELQRINRVTGLQFDEIPESLLGRQEEWEAFTESLLGLAIATWNGEIR